MKTKGWNGLARGAAGAAAVATASAALILGSSFAAAASVAPRPAAPAAGSCPEGTVVVSTAVNTPSSTVTEMRTGTFGAGVINLSLHGTINQNLNAIAFNPDDGDIYGVSNGTVYKGLLSSSTTLVGDIPGAPFGVVLGAFDNNGTYWVTGSSKDTIIGIDPATMDTSTITLDQSLGSAADYTYSDGFLWASSGNSDGLKLLRINTTTGHVDTISITGAESTHGSVGAFTYGNGNLGFYAVSGATSIYRVAVTNPTATSPTATLISTQQAPDGAGGDATACFHPAVSTGVDLQVTIDAPPAVAPGDHIDYTVTVHNNGPDASTGWTVTDTIPAGLSDVTTNASGCSINGTLVSCTGGALPVGNDAVIHFTGTAPNSGTITMPATVYGNDADTDPSNDHDTTDTQIAATPGAPMVNGEAIGIAGGAAVLIGGMLLLIRRRRAAGQR